MARGGGSVETGWSLWEWPGVLAEAIHHAVWRTPDGALIDVTPTRGHFKRVLFSPDPVATFDRTLARRRPNRMQALSQEPAVSELVAAANSFFQYLGDLDQGRIEAARRGTDPAFDALAAAHLTALHRVYEAKLRPTDRCICGSGRKFFRCCRALPPAEAFASEARRRRIWVMPQAAGFAAGQVAGAGGGIDGSARP